MIKVYFGPYKHSPAPELQHDERRFWLTEFHLLRGVTSDFWTNNPLMLDLFRPEQVHVYFDRWYDLGAAVVRLAPMIPEKERARLVALPPGKLALALEMIWRLQLIRNEDRAEQGDG